MIVLPSPACAGLALIDQGHLHFLAAIAFEEDVVGLAFELLMQDFGADRVMIAPLTLGVDEERFWADEQHGILANAQAAFSA